MGIGNSILVRRWYNKRYKMDIRLRIRKAIKCWFFKFDYILRFSFRPFHLSIMKFPDFRLKHDALISLLTPVFNGHELIRIGSKNDGGYILPDDMIGVSDCLSPGSNGEWQFEISLEHKYKIKSHILDKLEKKPQDLAKPHEFYDGFLGTDDREGQISLQSFIYSAGQTNNDNLILQMDIEGDEYAILDSVSDYILLKFRILIVEFHYFDVMTDIENLNTTFSMFTKINKYFDLVHLHPNNCCGVFNFGLSQLPRVFEATFHRKDRALSSEKLAAPLTHYLDEKNLESSPDVTIIFKSFLK